MATNISEGDYVTLRCEVSRVDGSSTTLRVPGVPIPVTLDAVYVENVAKTKAPRRKPLRDNPD